ncbi:MAG: hypothetical protein H6625_07415 [Bdellovibrionaceae bacterium]|nr:hypothetical protein [Pseudobdellovibrionaceae bacterium]
MKLDKYQVFPGGWTLSVLFGIAADHASESSFQIFDSNQFSTYLEENSSSLVNFREGRISREKLKGLSWTRKNEVSLVTYYFDFDSSYVMCEQTSLSDYFSGNINSILGKLPLELNMSNGAVCKSIYF